MFILIAHLKILGHQGLFVSLEMPEPLDAVMNIPLDLLIHMKILKDTLEHGQFLYVFAL